MMSSGLPRIDELRELVENSASPDACFQNFEQTLNEWPPKKRQFTDLERELQGLDLPAWQYLKKDVAPLLQRRHPTRGWQLLFDKLNHARAYNYLAGVGCTTIRFIPESPITGEKTPDLEAQLGPTKVVCEVKTINISEIEATRRTRGGVGSTEAQVSDGFFNKLTADLRNAKKQMDVYAGSSDAREIVYIVVNFDDSLHQYVDDYKAQIDAFLSTNQSPELEVQFDIKPPYYTAMS
jgi:hypothetical protein